MPLFLSEMLTNTLEKEKDEEEKERLREEITDLEEVLPDIIAKVRKSSPCWELY